MNTAGVSLTPAAIPRARPLARAPAGRVRSHRTRQARARLICPNRSVWKTGSSHRARAVAVQSRDGGRGRFARRAERAARVASRSTLPARKSAFRTGTGSQTAGTNRIAAKGG